ncbi:MAG: hypothetical protein A2939_04330 [Parcubacteria group bacterium RIFCSPLOWO2_01_FULL_48_18]|nr:MAG: hypothetical protein A2939_04330 [Parcubacteria group bacterium RIFCSPLOWO2_01_FULL_48_18]
MSELFPKFPQGKGRRFIKKDGMYFSENADLRIDDLVSFLQSTAFEHEQSIRDALWDYDVVRARDMNDIMCRMTVVIDMRPLRTKLGQGKEITDDEWRDRLIQWFRAVAREEKFIYIEGVEIEVREDDYIIRPASGIDPEVCARLAILTLDGKKYELQIVRIYNARMKVYYEYLLNEVARDAK